MKLEPIAQSGATPSSGSVGTVTADESFEPLLASMVQAEPGQIQQALPVSPLLTGPSVVEASSPGFRAGLYSGYGPRRAAAAYQQQSTPPAPTPQPNPAESGSGPMSAYQKYKDDQLLRNPGGDGYDLEHQRVATDQTQSQSWWGRVGKDLSDSFGNLKNLCNNFLLGARFCYRKPNNEIGEGTRRGVVGSVVDFFKDLGSALSFGQWRPDGSSKPEGVWERFKFFGSHLMKAFSRDLFDGVCGGVNHMAGDLVLAGWNLVEVLPDATIGNLESGRKLTTTLFDNGQVWVEYLTDIVPTGDAWLRVHAPSLQEFKLPVVYNLGMPEHFTGDTRWEYIRNTPFRKTIETIGALLADVAIGLSTGQVNLTSDSGPKRSLP